MLRAIKWLFTLNFLLREWEYETDGRADFVDVTDFSSAIPTI